MNTVIKEYRPKLIELCRLYKVDRLDLFGSAVKGGFNTETSDLDFIVSFSDRTPGTYLKRYLDFAAALEKLFNRPVDLLTEKSIRNPIFKSELEKTRQTIYEQRHEKTAA
jgi:predicted nucleotidyltransferase